MILAIALLVALMFAIGSFLTYNQMNKIYYIGYNESGNVDYQVFYQENGFFSESWIKEDYAYITSLIENILADFRYQMDMDTDNINFDYSYRIGAHMEIYDKNSDNPFYIVEDELLPCTQRISEGSSRVQIREKINIDFQHYNTIANQFISTYGLKNAYAMLVVTLHVQVLSTCDQFEANNENAYYTAINIPLNEETFSIHLTSSAPTAEHKVLAYNGFENKNVFLWTSYVASALTFLLGLALIIFANLTKNEDITYTAKIRRLLRSYSSFIQRIEGDFDDRDYQILVIKTFEELLGIRDTLQAPILMAENEDQTMSRFIIPTAEKLLYAFEIRVDNYDEIYGNGDDTPSETESQKDTENKTIEYV